MKYDKEIEYYTVEANKTNDYAETIKTKYEEVAFNAGKYFLENGYNVVIKQICRYVNWSK